jgi:DNA replication and repair protein RecF
LDLKTIQAGFSARLKQLRTEEIRRGVTSIGPHRDELRFLANGVDLANYGSRGQVRTALLALKMAEVNWMKDNTGQFPVILLDEVMAELDEERRADLLNYLVDAGQVMLTTTDTKLFSDSFVKNSVIWKVENGAIHN